MHKEQLEKTILKRDLKSMRNPLYLTAQQKFLKVLRAISMRCLKIILKTTKETKALKKYPQVIVRAKVNIQEINQIKPCRGVIYHA